MDVRSAIRIWAGRCTSIRTNSKITAPNWPRPIRSTISRAWAAGHFIWETLDTPAQRWIDKGMQVSFRISALESWMYKATPQWVFDAGAKGYDAAVWSYEPDYVDPVFLEKVVNFVRAMAER